MAIGSIVVDLMMRTGAFEEGAANAERVAKRRAAAIDQAFSDMGRNVAVGVGVATAALAAMVANTTQQANDIVNLARLSGATTDEFQRMAAAAKSVGVEQDQLGDIFKDFREKIGEFVATGGGEMKDFFEQVADKAGITADSFRNLSGPQALQLYVNSLEKAGLSTEQMSFYLESAANDATKLIPILQNGGAAATELGNKAETAGKIMSGSALASAKMLSDQINEMQSRFNAASNAIVLELAPSLVQVGKELTAVGKDGSKVEQIARGLANVFEFTAGAGAGLAFVFEAVGTGLGGLGAAASQVISRDFAGAGRTLDMLKSDLSNMALGYAQAISNIRNARANMPPPPATLPYALTPASPKGEGWSRANKEDKEGKKKADAAKNAAEQLAEQAKKDAQALKDAGRTESEVLMDTLNKYQALLDKKLVTLEDYNAAATKLVEDSPLFKLSPDFKDAEKDRADFTATVDAETAAHRENVLELGKRLEQMKLEAVFGERAAAVIEAMAIARLSEKAAILEGFEGTDEMVARLREEVQLRSEILKLGNPEDSDYWTNWLEAAQEAMTSFDELAGGVVNNFSSQFGAAFEKMIFDSESLGEAVSGLAEGMARSVVNALGQMAAQWIAYQVIQMAVGKTTAATEATALGLEASAMASMAGLAAFASTAAIPIVGPAAAPAAMAAALAVATPVAATVAGLSAAAAGARATGGPVSQNQTYLVGERGPELFVPNTNGAIVPNNKLGNGGGNITVNMIQNKERAGQTQERNDNGRREIDLFVADIMGDGPRAKAMRQAFGLQRRGY